MCLHRLYLAVIALACIASVAQAGDDKVAGLIVGRTGEILRISVPQPISEGAVFDIKPLEREAPIAQAIVVGCTKEYPYEALAKIVRTDLQTSVPIGVRAYVNVAQVKSPPKQIAKETLPQGDRFSLQAGAFYPSIYSVRKTTSQFWQAYRMNYSFLRAGAMETMLSAEYLKGEGTFTSGLETGTRQMEVIPVSLLGRVKPFRLGSLRVFFGAGAGMYRIRSEDTIGSVTTLSQRDEFGHELSAGLESAKGWILEARYRRVPDTDIKGYSLSFGTRF
ncbi:MAG TPA: hypothetical protein VFI02_13370 [Armatimonadota bacterium]|nr:hypothetical protein [Armatimonadota bacterium]